MSLRSTVKDTPQLSEPHGPGTSKLDWRYFENNKIEDCKVLICRESRGWEIRNEFFTRQFSGAFLKTNSRLNQSIDNITGATMSVNAMKKLSRMALFLHNHVITQQ